MRVFIADDVWTELTAGTAPAVRFNAPDLQQAQRMRRGLASAAILDVTVVVDADFRAAQQQLSSAGVDNTLSYGGTLDGLAGLLVDIYLAGVADGVTLIPAVPQQDARALAEAVSARVAQRLRTAA
ncbi:hypothetical protein MTOK_21240 [Mycolicibacterium tokaiense]|nr:hypothetical protein MTOK_21240 [Mycolicibacterium tokaiense]